MFNSNGLKNVSNKPETSDSTPRQSCTCGVVGQHRRLSSAPTESISPTLLETGVDSALIVQFPQFILGASRSSRRLDPERHPTSIFEIENLDKNEPQEWTRHKAEDKYLYVEFGLHDSVYSLIPK